MFSRKRLQKDRCSEPRPGERVPYVVVYGRPGQPLIQLVKEPHELIENPALRINAEYYISNQILPAVNRALSLTGVDVFNWYKTMPKITNVFTPMSTDTKKVRLFYKIIVSSCNRMKY